MPLSNIGWLIETRVVFEYSACRYEALETEWLIETRVVFEFATAFL